MNLNKSIDYFNPEKLDAPVHIIGCGAIGSSIAELMTRIGVTDLHLWDSDTVRPHNIANKLFQQDQVDMFKTKATVQLLKKINPDIRPTVHPYWTPDTNFISGYIFLCVDNIDLRRLIVQLNRYNTQIKAFFDTRMALEEGQLHATDMENDHIEAFLKTMDYSHEEAKNAVPVSACGIELSITPTVRILANYQVANFINFVNGKGLIKFADINIFNFSAMFYPLK